MKTLFTLILTLVFATTALAGPIKPPRGYDGQLYKGTFELYATLGQITHADCTATPFERIPGGYLLITAGHCVKLAPAGVMFSVAEDINGVLRPVTLLRAVYEGNIDFSEFEFKTDKKYPIVTLGDEYGSRVGDHVVNPNIAMALGKQISHGVISSEQLQRSTPCPMGCFDNFLVQMYDGRGASGSVVISEKTREVIGIVVYEFGSPVGFSVEPISRFYRFLQTPVIAPVPMRIPGTAPAVAPGMVP
jgi:hypothetical protein